MKICARYHYISHCTYYIFKNILVHLFFKQCRPVFQSLKPCTNAHCVHVQVLLHCWWSAAVRSALEGNADEYRQAVKVTVTSLCFWSRDSRQGQGCWSPHDHLTFTCAMKVGLFYIWRFPFEIDAVVKESFHSFIMYGLPSPWMQFFNITEIGKVYGVLTPSSRTYILNGRPLAKLFVRVSFLRDRVVAGDRVLHGLQFSTDFEPKLGV